MVYEEVVAIAVIIPSPTPHFLPDSISGTIEGWEMEKDSDLPGGAAELISPFGPGEKAINGHQLIHRARETGACFGQRHAQAMVGSVPEDWDYYVPFPGTVFRPPPRYRYREDEHSESSLFGRFIPCLKKEGGAWTIELQGLHMVFFNIEPGAVRILCPVR